MALTGGDDLLEDLDRGRDARRGERRAFFRGVLVGVALSVFAAGLLAVLALVVFNVLIETGSIPDTVAQRGPEIPRTAHDFLHERGIVEEGEEVLYFYSGGFFSYAEDGNLFTDRRVVSYWEDDGGELQVQQATYGEIDEIEVEYDEELFADSTIRVVTAGEGTIVLSVSNEEGRDEDFYELLVTTWKERR